MLKELLSFRSSEFKKNVAVVFTGSVASQLISVLTAPIIARIYSPENYGIFGLFLSIASIVAVLATLRYTQAILVSKTDEDAQRIMQFCLRSVFAVSGLILIVIAVGYDYVIRILSADDLGRYIFLLPFATFFTGLTEVYTTWLNRFKGYRALSTGRVMVSAVTVVVYLLWAIFYSATFVGLLVGMIIAQLVGALYLFLRSMKYNNRAVSFDWSKTVPLLSFHKKFPLYSLPTDLITVFTNQLPVFMLSRFAGSSEVGYFNMSQRLLSLPSTFISGAVGEVFKQRATEDFFKTGTCRPIFIKTFKALAATGIVPFALILFFGPWMFSAFLGAKWEMAGVYSRIFALMFFLRFINSPLSYILYIVNKQQYDIIAVIAFNIASLAAFWFGFQYFSTTTVIALYAGVCVLNYIAMLILNYKLSSHLNSEMEIAA
ncbi:MAG: oligosaccharide flippase family protein [Acidobacteriota bacterium]